ncbi:hypothetical protein Q8A67_012489 [Cirrhinus molitorella]|uniref:Uncharacterized protein n=1 Tax=Cirrhinus molitorella TaxID=172907 RepID=A0AA88TLB3_9TELE|nr:hypothetical protein Q8A67_012489 [Cirrhinus molitorella]
MTLVFLHIASAEHNYVYCLRCCKPQDNLAVHLARVCMKTSTPDERAEELQKAKASNREWIRISRPWDYEQLCEILPDRDSRVNVVKELLQYKLPTFRSVDVWKSVEAAAQTLPADRQKAVKEYLAHSTGGVQRERMQQPQFVVETAVLLDSLAGFTSDDEPDTPRTSQKDFSAFVHRFPISLDSQPPSKKSGLMKGFLQTACSMTGGKMSSKYPNL